MSNHSHCEECSVVIDEDEAYCDAHRPKPVLHARPAPTPCCSFCGKSQKEVKKMIAGSTVYICNECIALCQKIIDETE